MHIKLRIVERLYITMLASCLIKTGNFKDNFREVIFSNSQTVDFVQETDKVVQLGF